MTFHSTPTAHAAYLAGMTEDDFLAQQDAAADHEPDEREIDREDRVLVSEDDVLNPHEGIVRGYGGDHRVYFPGVDGE